MARKMSERSLENLEKGRSPFTPENARERQAKSVKARKARDLMREDLEKQLKKNGCKSIKAINQTSISLAEAGDDKARTYVAKAVKLYDDEEAVAAAGLTINIYSNEVQAEGDLEGML